MTKQSEKCVLAIYPNQLGFGYAIMTNALTLTKYQVVTSRPMSNKHLMKRIKYDIDYYEPDIVVLEDYKGQQSRKSKRVQNLIDSISTYAKTKNIETFFYSREKIKYVFAQFKAKTKYEIAKTISEHIPKLKRLLKSKRKLWQSESYWQGVFDASSLAITHFFMTE